MLNEERVKHMVKLAFYESTDGKEELKTSSYFKKDYISYNVLWSVIWMTIVYVLLMVLLGMTYMGILVENFSIVTVVIVGCAVVGIYIALLITYIVVSKKFYKKKHARAYHHVKKFKKDLTELEMLYEKEDINGEVI